jgi:beta-N-acetylhexosaminidase
VKAGLIIAVVAGFVGNLAGPAAMADQPAFPTWNLFSTNQPAKGSTAESNGEARHVPLPVPRPESKPAGAPPDASRLRQMVGQMLLIGFPGTGRAENWQQRIAGWVQASKIGGIILFSENVDSPQQVRQLTSSIAPRDGSLPPFVCVDQEGGQIQRLTPAKGFIGLPSAQNIGKMDPAIAFQLYQRSAQELISVGINCNFGPVVDLNVDPTNPAIGRLGRSYDRDPAKVLEFAHMFIDAHRQSGVLTVAKHFPGHGSARSDPHEQVVDITKTWREEELEPFAALSKKNGVDMIMVGHLIHPRFSDGDRPASLSAAAIQTELRQKLQFKGLVVSDDLDMGAIQTRYGVEEAAVMAIQAGSDLVIVANTKLADPDIADRIGDAIIQAVSDGRISKGAIEQSYARISKAKKSLLERRALVLH